MKKQTAYIFAAFIVVLIILAIVIMWLTGGIGGDKPDSDPGGRDERSAPDSVRHPDCHAAAHRGCSNRDSDDDGNTGSCSHSRSAERHGYRLGLV